MTTSTDELLNPFDDDSIPVLSPLEEGQDTSAINASAASAISGTVNPAPVLELGLDGHVLLPVGITRNGETIRQAEVRELTGEDEEAIAKSMGNLVRLVQIILERGTVRIGDSPATGTLLKDLLYGDRDALLLGIRAATFGKMLDVESYICSGCQREVDLSIDLTTIKVREGDDKPKTVALRKGGEAVVRFPNGHDQQAVFENPDMSSAEQNTVLLARCVQSITDADGRARRVNNSTTVVRQLGVADRKNLLRFIAENQPGPRYDDIEFTHDECGTVNRLAIGVVDLFRDL